MKHLLISFSFFFLFCFQCLFGCGDYVGTDNEFMLFRRGLNGNKSFVPFYYTTLHNYNFNMSDPDDYENLLNIKEWQKFIHDDKVSWSAIYQANYNLDAEVFLQQSIFPSWRRKHKNAFIDWLYKKENKEALNYFKLAKLMESRQFLSTDYWSPYIPDKDGILDVIQQARVGYENSQGFLKQRYLFQWIKGRHYVKNEQEYGVLKEAFDKTLRGSNSIVENWSYYYFANQQPTDLEQVKCVLEAFYRSREKRFPIVTDWYAVIRNVNVDSLDNPKWKESYYVVLGLRKFAKGLDYIVELNKVNPNSEFLAPLLEREINKLETYLWSKEILGFVTLYDDFSTMYNWWDDSYESLNTLDRWYLRQMIAVVSEFKPTKKKQSDIIHLSLSHLHLLNNDAHASFHQLEHLQLQKSSKMYEQYLMERILCIGQLKDISKDEVKQELFDLISEYRNRGNYSLGSDWWYDSEGFSEELDDLDELFVYLARCFELKGDFVTAGLLAQKSKVSRADAGYYLRWIEQREEYRDEDYPFDGKNVYPNIVYFDNYGSIEDVRHLIAFKHKKVKSEFEQLICPDVWCSDDFYKDLIVTKYIRQNKMHEAYQVAKTIDKDFWETAYEFADYLPKEDIRQIREVKWENYPSSKRISKVIPLQIIVDLKEKIKNKEKYTDDQLAKFYLELGNAYYNIGYYGDFWMMTNYSRSSSEFYEDELRMLDAHFRGNTKLINQYYNNEEGLKCYSIALRLAKDKELKALITLNKHAASITKESRVNKTDWNDLKGTKVFAYAKSLCPDIRW